jgi:hypothetical protein
VRILSWHSGQHHISALRTTSQLGLRRRTNHNASLSQTPITWAHTRVQQAIGACACVSGCCLGVVGQQLPTAGNCLPAPGTVPSPPPGLPQQRVQPWQAWRPRLVALRVAGVQALECGAAPAACQHLHRGRGAHGGRVAQGGRALAATMTAEAVLHRKASSRETAVKPRGLTSLAPRGQAQGSCSRDQPSFGCQFTTSLHAALPTKWHMMVLAASHPPAQDVPGASWKATVPH